MNDSVKTPAVTARFGYPFKTKEEKEFTDPLAFYKGLALVTEGHYLLGTHGFWHGGIHFTKASANTFSQEGGVRCLADGEVVAYRIDQTYPDAKPGSAPGAPAIFPYSTGFVLIKHRLQPPRLPAAPPVVGPPAPVTPPPDPLTLYSLYMHLGDHASYEANKQRGIPAWWKGPNQRLVKSRNKDPDPTKERQGLNVRVGPSSRTAKLGWLPKETVLAISETDTTGKWGKISSVISGQAEWFGTADPAAPKGWVHMPSLETRRTPDAYGSVVVLDKPHPIRAGEVVGFMGEDVPASTKQIGNSRMTRPMMHLEVFSGDDVPDFINRCRAYALKLPQSHWTLLNLKKGEKLNGDPANPESAAVILGELTAPQVIPLTATKLWTAADGKRWRELTAKVGASEVTGWVQEESRLCTPWHWAGFIAIDGPSTESGSWWDAPAEKFHEFLKGGEKPKESVFYQNLRKAIDHDGDGKLSEKELDAALNDRLLAPLIGRTIALHESEWASDPGKRLKIPGKLAKLIGGETLEKFEKEKARVLRLHWWSIVQSKLKDFPSKGTYHFHPIGLSGCFGHRLITELDILIRRIGDIISHGEGNYEAYNTGTKGVPEGRVGFSFMHPAAGTVTQKSINEIIATDNLSGLDRNRMFATGKYQTIISTLKSTKRAMNLTGDELYDEEMQERVFREYLIDKAGGGVLAAYIKEGKGTLDDAMYAASKEWASIAAPSGRVIVDGRISNGNMSYYQKPGTNSSNSHSTSSLREILNSIQR